MSEASRMRACWLLVDLDVVESILSHLHSADDIVMAERTCTHLCQVVRRSARVWHAVAQRHIRCARNLLDAETRSDWRFWRAVCVDACSSRGAHPGLSALSDSLLDDGQGICTFPPHGQNVLSRNLFSEWCSEPIDNGDPTRATATLTFVQLGLKSTMDELEYTGCLISEVRIQSGVDPIASAVGGARVACSPREASATFECAGATFCTPPCRVAASELEQTIAKFEPPLLLSPGLVPPFGKLTLTLVGAHATGRVRLVRVRVLGKQIYAIDYRTSRPHSRTLLRQGIHGFSASEPHRPYAEHEVRRLARAWLVSDRLDRPPAWSMAHAPAHGPRTLATGVPRVRRARGI
jgi:hypothetical protein